VPSLGVKVKSNHHLMPYGYDMGMTYCAPSFPAARREGKGSRFPPQHPACSRHEWPSVPLIHRQVRTSRMQTCTLTFGWLQTGNAEGDDTRCNVATHGGPDCEAPERLFMSNRRHFARRVPPGVAATVWHSHEWCVPLVFVYL